MKASTRVFFSAVLVASFSAAIAGCPSDPNPGDASVPSYAEIQAIYTRSCTVGTSCHSAGAASAGLSLAEGMSYAATVDHASAQVTDMKLVAPGRPEQSYLLRKIDGSYASIPFCSENAALQVCGTRMPMVGGAPLSAAELASIRAWIAAGAPGP